MDIASHVLWWVCRPATIRHDVREFLTPTIAHVGVLPAHVGFIVNISLGFMFTVTLPDSVSRSLPRWIYGDPRRNSWMLLVDLRHPYIDQICLYSVTIRLFRHVRPSDEQIKMAIFPNSLVPSMIRETVPDPPLPNVNNMRVGAAMPNDVNAVYGLKMRVVQIDGIELTPNVTLALHPANIHRMSP